MYTSPNGPKGLDIPAAENALATIGTIFWCIQLVPQIIRNYRVKNCEGLPASMMLLWAASGVPFSIYFCSINSSIPLQIQPQLFTFFCLLGWIQTLYYPPVQASTKGIIWRTIAFVVISAALEGTAIGLLRNQDRPSWPYLFIGIVASILLAAGLIPPYFELAKRGGRVVGLNFIFLAMDSSGALFSLISLFFGKQVDVLSLVLYAIVLALEAGIASSQVVWYLTIGRGILKKEKEKEREQQLILGLGTPRENDQLSPIQDDATDEYYPADIALKHPDCTTSIKVSV